jgi:Papain family cysteine protease
MTGKGDAIDAEIDLRSACHGIRDQGDRPTCLACTTSDAHSMSHKSPPLSAEFLFYHAIRIAKIGNLTDGILFAEAAAALAENGQPAEAEWPYNPVQPETWNPPVVTTLWQGSLDYAEGDPINSISALVRNGRPVVLGVRLSAAFLGPVAPNYSIPGDGDGFGGHAVLVVGLGRDASGAPYFLIRNSWGDRWGDGGYAWLAVDYLTDKYIGFAPVTARP